MKHNIIYISVFGILLLFGCQDEDSIRYDLAEIERGPNVRIQVDANSSFLDFENLSSSKFAYDVYTENDDIRSIQLFLEYYDLDADSTYEEILVEDLTLSSFTDGHLRVEYSAAEMAGLFNLPGGADDLGGGDLFNFRNQTVMDNGIMYPDSVLAGTKYSSLNVSSTITASAPTTLFTTDFFTFVGCPSSLAGTYTAVSTATSTDGCCPTEITVTSEISISQEGPTTYTLPNFAFGSYNAWYCAPYGLCAGTFDGLGGSMQDICGNLTTSAGYWGSAGVGTVDAGSGVLTVTWSNVFGDAGTTVLTPK